MTDCPFEGDVLDALASRRWPARIDGALRAHVGECASCRDLAETAAALFHEEAVAHQEAHPPAAATVWHRAQLRAVEDDTRAATRPIAFAQGVAFTCGVALVLTVAAWALPLLAAWLPDLSSLIARAPMPGLPDVDLAALLSNTTLQVALAGTLVLSAPIAVYFAISRE